MVKLIIAPVKYDSIISTESWLNLEEIASVEITSEEVGFPVESAFSLDGDGKGWRAGRGGPQTIRLIFDRPQQVKRIWVLFEERERERTQEFVLRWSGEKGTSFREIVRQQWNFGPPDAIREIENYKVDLPEVSVLEMIIVPDNRGGEARNDLLRSIAVRQDSTQPRTWGDRLAKERSAYRGFCSIFARKTVREFTNETCCGFPITPPCNP